MTQKALKLALEALKKCRYRSLADEIVDPAITAIKEALAQTQEPVETYIHEFTKLPHPGDFGIPKGHWWQAKQYADALQPKQEPDDIASILACRDMLDAQPVSEVDRVIWPERTEQEPVAHWSDCAVHSEPAYPKGECDCGGIVAVADYTALSDKYVALSDKYVALKAQHKEQEPDVQETLHWHAFNYRQAHTDQAHEMWQKLEQFVDSKIKAPQRTEQEPVALPCCGYADASAVKWNPFNNVVQCHNCGQVYTKEKL